MKRDSEHYTARKWARRRPHPRKVERDFRARVRAGLLVSFGWERLPSVLGELLGVASRTYAGAVQTLYSWDTLRRAEALFASHALYTQPGVLEGVQRAQEHTRGIY